MKKTAFIVMAVPVVAILAGCPWPYGNERPYVGRWENPTYAGSWENDVVEWYDNNSGIIHFEPQYQCEV